MIATLRRILEPPHWSVSRVAALRRRVVLALPYDQDGDGEGTWHRRWDAGLCRWQITWSAPKIDEADRCESLECLFGREWIGCKKRKGHTGVHRNCETWGWAEGDEKEVRA
jgi:hypothetical protein